MTQITFHLNQAYEEIDAATLLLEKHYYRACISRCYYSIYNATQALLISKKITTTTHRGIRQQFNQTFISTGDLPKELAKAMRITYDLRQLGDYEQATEITQSQAKTALNYAKLFLETATKWLTNHQ